MGIQTLAFDFGASSGRALLGEFDGGALSIREVHRFSNEPVMVGDTFYWDLLRLFYDVKLGLGRAAREGEIQSVGVDTWGVDYGLLDAHGRLLGNPTHYRAARTKGVPAEVFSIIPREELFARTGSQVQPFNTIYQLFAERRDRPEVFSAAKTMLLMPDLFNYLLTGARTAEYTIASTAQLLDAKKRDWDYALLDRLGYPRSLFPEIVMPGTKVGAVTPALQEELGVPAMPVYAVAGHDTGSAFADVPAQPGENSAYLSCGTW